MNHHPAMRQRGRVRTPGYIVFFWLVALVLAGSAVGSVAKDWHWSWEPVVFTAAPLLLAMRGLRLAVDVTADEVVIRNLVRTLRVPRQKISKVAPRNYDGYWMAFGESKLFATVAVTANDRDYIAYCLVGRRATALRAADRLGELLGLRTAARGQRRHEFDR